MSEDAYFCTRVHLEDENDQFLRDVTYFGVADGVGSWRQYGVDPRLFSHKLMEECENILLEACHRDKDIGGGKFRRVIPPADIIAQAYERVKAENIIGSSTACVALFDCIRHQLHFSNLGDSGIIVLRHIDSDIAGTLKRDRITPRAERSSDLRVAFISQQQLFSFNHPYQVGWTGEELSTDEHTSFKTARDSCTTSIHLRRGDIIIMATDGCKYHLVMTRRVSYTECRYPNTISFFLSLFLSFSLSLSLYIYIYIYTYKSSSWKTLSSV